MNGQYRFNACLVLAASIVASCRPPAIDQVDITVEPLSMREPPVIVTPTRRPLVSHLSGILAYDAVVPGHGYDLFAVRPDGSLPWAIASTDADEHDPRWSPTGGELLYVTEGPNQFSLHRYSVSDNASTQLYESQHWIGMATWSPDSRAVAFVQATEDRSQTDIFVLSIQNGEIVQVTHSLGIVSSPVWSYDGKKLAYLESLDESSSYVQILDVEPTWGEPAQIGPSGMYYTSPRWSPDGTKLAVSVADVASSSSQVGYIDLASGDLFMMGDTGAPAFGAVWANRENLVSFTFGIEGHESIRLVDANAADLAGSIITSFQADSEWSPTFSPDDQYVAYLALRDGVTNVFVVDRTGQLNTQITYDSNSKLQVVWGKP